MLFFVAVLLLTACLALTAMIPRSAIQEHVRESAEYLCEGELFGELADGVQGSKIDRYADSILLAIAYQYDAEQPLESVMTSSYYYTDWKNENENLLDAVTEGYDANQQYLRYWHGSNVVVRPLLLIFNIQAIYVLNAVVLGVLVVILLVMLMRHRAFLPAVGMVAGLVATAVWVVPCSLEYTWTYLLMLLMSVVGCKLAFAGRWNMFGCLFLLDGILTNYVDFLTTETVTLLVPLLFVLWIDRHKHPEQEPKNLFYSAAKSAFAWGCGYIGMWIMKWVMASVVLGENVMPYVSGHVEERLGLSAGVSLWIYIPEAVKKNLSCLFPFEYGVSGSIVGFGLLIFMVYIGYVYRKEHICKGYIVLYAIIGLVPYLRYMVLLNHSFLHFFFTYRAQVATVLAIVLLLEELTDGRWLLRGNAGKRKP